MALRDSTTLQASALLATLAAFLGFQAWIVAKGHRQAGDFIATRAANRAQATANQVGAAIQQTDLFLLDVRGHLDAADLAPGGPAPGEERRAHVHRLILERMKRLPHVLALQVVDAHGRYVFTSFDALPEVSLADRAYFAVQRDAAQDRLLVSEGLVARVTRKWAVIATRPVLHPDGRFAGLLVATLDAERLGSVLVAVDQRQWVLALYDANRRLVARRPDRPDLYGTPAEPALAEALASGAQEPLRAAAVGEPAPHLWAVLRVPGLPLTAVAGYSAEAAFEQWRRDLRVHLAAALLLSAGVLALLLMQRRHLRLSAELRASEARLHHAEKLEALGRLAGGIAHDFNNSLAGILGAAEVVTERATDPELLESGRDIISAAERAGLLTRQLLAFARKGMLASAPVDVNQVLRETASMLKRTLGPKVALEVGEFAGRAEVEGDASQIQNAIINLCLNARDAMPEGGRVALRTERVRVGPGEASLGTFEVPPGDYLRVDVADTGSGIPASDLPRVFDPFFTTKAPGKGTGLGLASVHGTMASHRGAVTVESRPGAGATFRLYFPVGGEGRSGQGTGA